MRGFDSWLHAPSHRAIELAAKLAVSGEHILVSRMEQENPVLGMPENPNVEGTCVRAFGDLDHRISP